MADPAYQPTLVWGGDSLVWADRTLAWAQFVEPPDTLGEVLTVKEDRAMALTVKEDRGMYLTVKVGQRRP